MHSACLMGHARRVRCKRTSRWWGTRTTGPRAARLTAHRWRSPGSSPWHGHGRTPVSGEEHGDRVSGAAGLCERTDGLAGGNQHNILQNKLKRRPQAETWAVRTNQRWGRGRPPTREPGLPSQPAGSAEPPRPGPTVSVHTPVSLSQQAPSPPHPLPSASGISGTCSSCSSP